MSDEVHETAAEYVTTAEVTDSDGAQSKYPPSRKRGLIPWQPGQSGNPIGRPLQGPIITPRIRSFASLTLPELEKLYSHPDKLTGAEAVALTILMDALKTGVRTTGHHSREQLLERLDGPVQAKVAATAIVNFTLSFDGPQASPDEIPEEATE